MKPSILSGLAVMLVLLLAIILLAMLGTEVKGQEPPAKDRNGKISVSRFFEGSLPENPQETKRPEHQAFWILTSELSANLQQLLGGKLSDSWTVNISLICAKNHAKDRVEVAISNSKGDVTITTNLQKLPSKANATKTAEVVAEGIASFIRLFDTPSSPKNVPPPKDKQQPPPRNDPAPGRRATERAGAPLFLP